ncbi:hypothetical protein GCM10009647_038030 [Streptomyces sanglieri]
MGSPVSREIWVSVTPSPCLETVSRTRRAYCTEWNGAVGSGFNATVSPYQVVTASSDLTIAAKTPFRGGCWRLGRAPRPGELGRIRPAYASVIGVQ